MDVCICRSDQLCLSVRTVYTNKLHLIQPTHLYKALSVFLKHRITDVRATLIIPGGGGRQQSLTGNMCTKDMITIFVVYAVILFNNNNNNNNNKRIRAIHAQCGVLAAAAAAASAAATAAERIWLFYIYIRPFSNKKKLNIIRIKDKLQNSIHNSCTNLFML